MNQEHTNLKNSIEQLKQDHSNEIQSLITQLNETHTKVEYYEEILKRNRTRIDSNIDEICRSNNDSKTGESTIESDKLTSILKVKEDHIKHLMHELKQRVMQNKIFNLYIIIIIVEKNLTHRSCLKFWF